MSDNSPQPLSRREQKRAERDERRAAKAERKDTKRAARQGRKMLKAGYALAATNRKRIDPAIREQIGRARLTPADLQVLANSAVNARFEPGRYGVHAQQLGQAANARLAQAGPAPTNNWFTRHNRYSRWRRNERAGTKALKQAFTRAARDVKRTDPSVLAAIGRSRFNSMDLAALSSGQIGRVFQPQNAPGQQAQGAGRAPQAAGMIQSREAARRGPAPQSEQMNQRIMALQQSIIENQQRTIALMEQNNQLQAQMRDLLQERAVQVQQGDQLANSQQDLGQQNQRPGQRIDDRVRIMPAIDDGQPRNEPAVDEQSGDQARGEGDQQAVGEQSGDQTRGEDESAVVGGDSQTTGDQELGEGGDPQAEAVGDQELGEGEVEGGDPQAVGDQELGEGGEAVEGGDLQAVGEQDLGEGETAVEGGEVQSAPEAEVQQAPEAEVPLGEQWTQSAEEQNQYANEQPDQQPQQPAATGQQPQQPAVAGQQPQQAGVGGQVRQGGAGVQTGAGQGSTADRQAAEVRRIAMGAQQPLKNVSGQQAEGTDGQANGEDPNRRQRTTQTPSRPSGKEGR